MNCSPTVVFLLVGMSELKEQSEGGSEPDAENPADAQEMTLLKLIRSRRGKLGVLTHKQNEIQAHMAEFGKSDKHAIKLKKILEKCIQLQNSVQNFMSEEEQE